MSDELQGEAWRERRRQPNPARPSFGTLAREAIEKHVPEVRTPEAWWSIGSNALWVRWPVARGIYAYLGIHRHLGWVSGEAGVSQEPQELSALFPLPGVPAAPVPGYRIRLGHLLEGQDRWWPVGNDVRSLIERLEWLALQLRVKGNAYFSHYPAPAGSQER